MKATDRIILSPQAFDAAATWLFCPRSDTLEISNFSNQYFADLFANDLILHLSPILRGPANGVGLVEVEVERLRKRWVVKIYKRGDLH